METQGVSCNFNYYLIFYRTFSCDVAKVDPLEFCLFR